MNIGDIAKLQRALENWDEIEKVKQAFIDANDFVNGTPSCGWEKWDESMTDFNVDLADAGDALAGAIREVIG